MGKIKLAVLSDLHVAESDADKDATYLYANCPEIPAINPVCGIEKLIRDSGLSADYLLCAGDISNKAHPTGITAGWMYLNRLKAAFGARKVIATNGNHDLDSRFSYNDHDPRGLIQSLTPPFPFDSKSDFNQYWARGFATLIEPDVRYLIVNTSAYHGYGNEKNHGRISKYTLDEIEQDLAATQKKPLNILLCHHHPMKHGDIDMDDYSNMHGGEQLLRMLGNGEHGRWLVVHGHRHFPTISNAAGMSHCPVVFSCGSFSAVLFELASRVRNQFYLIEVDTNDLSYGSTYIKGQFTAWDWIANKGWQPAKKTSGLPHKGGFGYRGVIDELIEKIYGKISQADGPPFVTIEDVVAFAPEYQNVLPSELQYIVEKIEERNVSVLFDKNDRPAQFKVMSK